MKLTSLMNDFSAQTYYDEGYRVWIDSFMPYIRSRVVRTINVPPSTGYKYQGDYYGLLDSVGIPKPYHYLVMQFNGYRSSTDYDGSFLLINIPDLGYLDQLASLYKSSKKNF